jgi:hypothetical protein
LDIHQISSTQLFILATCEDKLLPEHDSEKWMPVSRLREALARLVILA